MDTEYVYIVICEIISRVSISICARSGLCGCYVLTWIYLLEQFIISTASQTNQTKTKLKKIIPRVQYRRFKQQLRKKSRYSTPRANKQTNKQKRKQKDDIKMTALIRRRFALDLFTRNLVVKKFVASPTFFNASSDHLPITSDWKRVDC